MKKSFLILSLLGLIYPSIVTAQEATQSATPSATLAPTPEPTLILSELPTTYDLQLTTDNSISSAQIREELVIKKLKKSNFQIDESVTVSLENTYDSPVEVAVLDANGEPAALPIHKEQVGDDTVVSILPTYQAKPGKYQLRISTESGVTSTQEFTWGVLALNPDKSIYLPGQTASIAIAVLDDFGVMVCNANVTLIVTSPKGEVTTLSTFQGDIKINPECNVRDLTIRPDYETSFAKTHEIGTYQLSLTAETPKGKYTIFDSFLVQDQIRFDITRTGPTRIFPLKSYPMKATVKFNESFFGKIVETVPASFSITNLDGTTPFSQVVTEELNPAGTPEISIISPLEGDYPTTQGFGESLTDMTLASLYKSFGLRGHDGLDYSVPENTPVRAVDDGRIIQSGNGAYGITVTIQHSWGKTYYGHLNQNLVSVDQIVKKGDKIGLSGNTGISTGPHLHFGVKPENSNFFNGFFGKVDPVSFLSGSISTTQSVKKIIWDIQATSGQVITLGYEFDAPEISPEYYLTGPLKFYSQSVQSLPPTEIDTSSDNPFVLGATTESQDLVFAENRQWQIAADADITIDSNTNPNSPLLNKDFPNTVFITDQIGYSFYNDHDGAGNGDCVYAKTTDGGASWGAAVTVFDSALSSTACVPWYDRWTPGDVTGNYIHVLIGDSNGDDMLYDRIDTANSDTQAGETIIQDISTNIAAADTLSLTKGTNGYLYAGNNDANSGRDILRCTGTCTTGSNWASMTDNLDALDPFILLPLLGDKIIAVRQDASQDDLDYDVLTGTTWAGFVDIDTDVAEAALTAPSFGATVHPGTGYIYTSYVPNQSVVNTSEVRSAVFDGSSWTLKTDVIPDSEPAATDMIIYTDISLNIETLDVFVAYSMGTSATVQDMYYKKSTDGMSTWSTATQLNTSNTNGDNTQLTLSFSSNERIYFRYRNNGTDDGLFGGTVENLTPPSNDELMRHGMWFTKAGAKMQYSF